MPYQARRYRRRRRRNSHYGVLIALILLIVIAVPVGFRLVKGVTGAIFGGSKNQVVFQVYNSKAYVGGEIKDMGGAAPFVDDSGTAVVPLKAMCESLGLEPGWEQVSKTASITHKKDTVRVTVGSKTLRFNDETRTMATAPAIVDGTTYVPVREICEALSWKTGTLDATKGDLIVVSKSKKELDDEKLTKIAEEALPKLGPSRQQVVDGSVLLRVDSDKLLLSGEAKSMTDSLGKRGCAVMENDGTKFVPLEGAVTAMGGEASKDDKNRWTVKVLGRESTVEDNGKAKVDGKRVKGDNLTAHTDPDSGRFYVSAQLFAALIGEHYSDLNDGNGTLAFTKSPLDGYDSQKAYLDSMQSELTQSVGGNIPEADVYIALSFDDGPTGPLDGYPEGLTAHLLDGLKERGAHATFFMVGERIKGYDGTMNRLLEEGHELGNHTMTHPGDKLSGLDAESVYDQVESNSKLIEEKTGHRPTVMRPVGGGVNATVKEQMKAIGVPIVNWSVDTEDWRIRDKESVRSAIVNTAGDGDIVLMHDLYTTSVEGCLAAIDDLQSRTDKTYAFVTISELAAIKGITLEPGVVYNNLSAATAQSIQDGTYSPAEFT